MTITGIGLIDAMLISVYLFVTSFNIIILIVFLIFSALAVSILLRKINYLQRIIEIQEAPLNISNLLRDPIKRSILRTLKEEKKYVSLISKNIGENAPRTSYHLKQLENAGLLKSFKLTREAYFTLTNKGRWCIDAINFYYPKNTLDRIVIRTKRKLGLMKLNGTIFKKGKDAKDAKIDITELGTLKS